jgi:hypothetical protein
MHVRDSDEMVFQLEFNLTFGFGALSCWQVSVDFG